MGEQLKELELDDQPALRSVLMRAREVRGCHWVWQIKIGGHRWLRGLIDHRTKAACVRNAEQWAADANYEPEWIH